MLFIFLIIKKLIDEMPRLYSHGMWLNNRHKVLVKWILVSLTNGMPAPAMKFKLATNLISTRVSCHADSCC